MSQCQYCGKLILYPKIQYCSNKCQSDLQYFMYIKAWKARKVAGSRGVVAKNISGHVNRYSISKWGERNPVTGSSPLEIDHIDGNSENNKETNLRLECPNSHSLTNNYKNMNRGNGRAWRRLKYLKAT